MNRDNLKFRAWSIRERKYYYDIEDAYSNDSHICSDIPNDQYGYPDYHRFFGEIITDPGYIIEQCTGLKDKNGKLIYEGDIITTAFEFETPTEYDTHAVKWREAYAGELFCTVDARGEPTNFYGGIPCVEYCRVIGNIHEMEVTK